MKYLIILVLISGCVDINDFENIFSEEVVEFTGKDEGVLIELKPSSDNIFSGETFDLYIDIRNNMTNDINNVNIKIFGSDLFTTNCKLDKIPNLKTGVLETKTCNFNVEEITTKEVIKDIHTKINFSTTLSVSQSMNFITQEEFKKRTNKLTYPKSYTYNDGNIELNVEFSSEPPFIDTDENYATFKIKNIGEGFVNKLNKVSAIKYFDGCNFDPLSTYHPLKKEFPSVTCKIVNPNNINYLSNDVVIINIDYEYELRESLPIKIIR